jgi:DNA-binding NarL/FixJ family response regulator
MLLAWVRAEGGTTSSGAAGRQVQRARELLRQATAVARELGMTPVLEDCERLLAGIAGAAAAATSSTAAPNPLPAACHPGGLTAREAEVLQLIATGATNQEIADTLVVSVRTVERHLLHVYSKIGARRRADAVAYVLRERLA